ncbi:hypothetical protein OAG36_00515 [bacterium]|nr:hypothetical protein [bacterium]
MPVNWYTRPGPIGPGWFMMIAPPAAGRRFIPAEPEKSELDKLKKHKLELEVLALLMLLNE